MNPSTPAAKCDANPSESRTHGWQMLPPVESKGVIVQYARCILCNNAELIIAKREVMEDPYEADDFSHATETARDVARKVA